MIFSPKFNEDILYSPNQIKELITHTKESKKYENSSYKYSEFTFNNGKDNSICNINTFVLESENSSRVFDSNKSRLIISILIQIILYSIMK
jgi:hypothetical protein